MKFEPLFTGGRVECVKATCDDCERGEVFACQHKKNARKPEVDEGKATRKIQEMGWAIVKNKLRCPTCEAKRKVVAIKPVAQEPEKMQDAAEHPTKEQKRQIIDMLGEVYDTAAGRYSGGETDSSVAHAIGNGIRPGWVAALRDDLFGPAGENEDMAELSKALSDAAADLAQQIKDCTTFLAEARKSAQQVQEMQTQLDRIRKAVGPHTIAKAGLRSAS